MTTPEPAQWMSAVSIRWSLSVVFMVCLAATLLVSIQSRANDDRLDKALITQQSVLVQTDANNRQLKTLVADLCKAGNVAATNNNAVIDSVIKLVSHTGSLPAAEQKARVKILTETPRSKILKCAP